MAGFLLIGCILVAGPALGSPTQDDAMSAAAGQYTVEDQYVAEDQYRDEIQGISPIQNIIVRAARGTRASADALKSRRADNARNGQAAEAQTMDSGDSAQQGVTQPPEENSDGIGAPVAAPSLRETGARGNSDGLAAKANLEDQEGQGSASKIGSGESFAPGNDRPIGENGPERYGLRAQGGEEPDQTAAPIQEAGLPETGGVPLTAAIGTVLMVGGLVVLRRVVVRAQ